MCAPLVVFCEERGIDHETLLRAVALSNLVSIRIKRDMPYTPTCCGQVNAASGVGAALTYLSGGSDKAIEDAIRNSLGNTFGILCDGAKPSCAAKISSALDGAIIGYLAAMDGDTLEDGSGMVKQDLEKMIDGLALFARESADMANQVILDVMLQ